MRITPILPALALLICLTACTQGGMLAPRTVEVDGKFSLSIPGNLIPCKELHGFAPLQYADEQGGYFIVGIDEPKEAISNLQYHYTLGDYAYFVESTIGEAYDTVHVSQRDTLEINDLKCQTTDLYATITSEEAPLEVYYHLAVFESEANFYQVIAWTHRDGLQAFRSAAAEMDRTFRELPDIATYIQTAAAD